MCEKRECDCQLDKVSALVAAAWRKLPNWWQFPAFDPAEAAAVVLEPAALVAAGEDGEELPSEWHACLTVEGLRTTDHRKIAPMALTWRELPLAIFAQFNNAGHYDAPIVGQILTIERDEATGRIMATGTFDLTIEDGQQAARMCKNQTLRWGSVDLEVLESRYVEVNIGSGGGGSDFLDIIMIDDDPAPTDWYDEIIAGRIMGYTMVATPAFPQAVIAPMNVELDIPEPMGEAVNVNEGLMAAGIPTTPPAAWFTDPGFEGPTALTITSEGHIFGHLALWNTCHTGFSNTCIVPPESQTDYAYFLTGKLETKEGQTVRVGQITFETGHAGSTQTWQDAAAHYDNTGAAGADVTVGEDEFGIWFSGALRSTLSEEQVRVMRAHPLSGDWRKIGGSLELMAALSVPVPGFPIAASAGVRQGEQVSLIASGVKPKSQLELLAEQVGILRQAIRPLLTDAVSNLSERVNGSPQTPSLEELTARVNLGGHPNKGTPKDKRLKKNKAPTPA